MIKMNYAVLLAATAVAALSTSLLQVVHAEQMSSAIDSYTWEFDGCDVDTYYNDVLSAMDRSTLQLLLKETHRNVLPYTREGQPGLDDVWSALMDVDQGSIPGTVQLLYTDTQIEAIPFGQRSWVKEQIWPVDRGIGLEPAADLSDVHNIRPTGVLSDIVRGDSYFGECGVLIGEDVTTCQQPAEGSADDTCRCNGRSGAAGLYTPPTTRKGEIARALLYMDLRYDGSEALTEDLRLTDCPFEPETDMAYLSQMIQWHLDDPPSETEIARNDQVCLHWQGNRNPFVDFPELAVMLHYEPYELPAVGERRIYQECESIPTSSPTKEPNTCDFVNVGDIYVWLLNSDDPDSIGLYSFVGLPPGFELYMTDNPWNGTNFLEQEGTVDSDGTLMVSTAR
jgi:endonuclease I/DNA-binding protein Fis